ncbi:hypothetical protein KFU94_62725 [Chloroflexi bacterium TSY]|nr:hypothetical protein [Chloroflexi bacterium TSY]
MTSRNWFILIGLSVLLIAAGCAVSVPGTVPGAVQMTDEEQAAIQAEAAEKGITVEQALILAQLDNQGTPPELTNETWFNSEPLQLADLRGNVVIVEFWTYG